MILPILTLLFLAGCGIEILIPRDGEDAGNGDGPRPPIPDGGEVDGGPDTDGGVDGGNPFPVREGIQERWAKFDNCNLVDLVVAEKQLYALCQGNPNRLVSCPVSKNLDPVSCDDFIIFSESLFENGSSLTVNPLVHDILDDRYSVVSFTTTPGNYPGFFVVDRGTQRITDKIAIPPQIIRGGGPTEIFYSSPFGAMIFGSSLLVAAQSCAVPMSPSGSQPGCTSWSGTLLNFAWNGNGTFDHNLDNFNPLFTTHKNPTLFWRKADNATWILNNGSTASSSPSSFDVVDADSDGKPTINSDNNRPVLPNGELESLKHLAISPDKTTALLANRHNLVLYSSSSPSAHTFIWQAPGKIISADWFSSAMAFVSDSESKVHSVSLEPNQLLRVVNTIPVYEKAAASALDLSGCIYYCGTKKELSPDNYQSFVTAIRCNVLSDQ